MIVPYHNNACEGMQEKYVRVVIGITTNHYLLNHRDVPVSQHNFSQPVGSEPTLLHQHTPQNYNSHLAAMCRVFWHMAARPAVY